MKFYLLLLLLLGNFMLPTTVSPEPQNRNHKIVFEFSSDRQESWESLLNNVQNVQKALGLEKTEVEVVAHGEGIGLLLITNTKLQDRIKQVAEKGVVFAACENTMRRKNIKKEDLFPFVKTVDSGVAEVVRKQEAGWSYIKGGA